MTTLPPDWKPTPENINALPFPLRRYIHALEADCDPAGTIRSEVIMREHTVPELESALAVERDRAREAALEEAAKVATAQYQTLATDYPLFAVEIATRIRSLTQPTDEDGDTDD